ncbi:FliM/FliN family flagellar motor switch protein [Providencia rettgeri]|uniref:FliM/FliN family flagellar motor switch protein n=1 Tax=Providencia rettgeri TaxID=587 RepID=UPI0034E0B580
MLNIRRVSLREKQLKTWQQQYQVDVVSQNTPADQRYFSVYLQNETQNTHVLVHAERWCRYRWPDLTHYAWAALDDKTLCDMFIFENSDKRFFDKQFSCYSVEMINNADTEKFGLLAKEDSLGDAMLLGPIAGLTARKPISKQFENLLVPADWVLGDSYISLSLLRSLSLGDALYIQKLQLHMLIGGRVFARFQKQEEGLFMIEEILQPEDTADLPLSEDYQDEIERPFNLDEMSIKLTFVLGHSDIAISEIDNIQPGSIYSIGKNKEREVKVYANKQLVAEGELIYLGDNEELGLEITRIISLGDKRV